MCKDNCVNCYTDDDNNEWVARSAYDELVERNQELDDAMVAFEVRFKELEAKKDQLEIRIEDMIDDAIMYSDFN